MAVTNISVNNDLFHSLVHDYKGSFSTLESIIKDGGIIPPSRRNTTKRYGCHKSNEICICMQTNNIPRINLYASCFDLYLKRLVTIVIDKKFSNDFKIYKPNLITTDDLFLRPDLVNSGNHTNLYDEYRTKDIVPIEYFKGISLPYDILIEDPITFFTFLVEEAMVEYYNFGLEQELIRLIREEQSGTNAKEERKRMIDQYIESIKDLFSLHNIDIPVYSYGENKTFTLKF